MKLTSLILVLMGIASVSGAELTSVDEPESDDPVQVEVLVRAGISASAKVRKQVFSRDGTRVAELVSNVVTINEKVQTTHSIQFRIDDDNWVFINLDKPEVISSRTTIDVHIASTSDSVTISAPQRKYFEVFFKSTRKFLEGETRDTMAANYSKKRPTLR